MDAEPKQRVERYRQMAGEARELSLKATRHDLRRSLTLLAAMWAALAKHAESSARGDHDGIGQN